MASTFRTPYAELHAHTNFSFLDGASAPDELVERAVELGLTGLAATDHNGLYGAVRFTTAAHDAGLHPVIGAEIELLDPAVADPSGIVVPPRRQRRRGRTAGAGASTSAPWSAGEASGGGASAGGAPAGDAAGGDVVTEDGRPTRPRPDRARLPGHRDPVKEDFRGIGARARGPRLVLLARSQIGWRSLCRLMSRANMAGTKGVPRFRHALLDEHHEDVIALSGGRSGEVGRRLLVGDRAGARAAAERLAARFGDGGFAIELGHHLLPDDDWLVTESAALAADLRLPVVVTNAVHYARPEDRELHDVLTAIKHGRTLETLADLRRVDGESYLKSGDELAALGATLDGVAARAWHEGIERSVAIAAACSVDLGFEQYRFPGFPVPDGETPFSYLSGLCWDGARRRYHPLTPVVVKRLAHELDVIERAGLAEFFLICWDLMVFAKQRGIPAQGRGSAAGSIVTYVLGISRVEPIRHDLLFERFINEGRTTYPDVDIDFSSERREEVIQYVYERYGSEHTGMVCNLVTYRARSAVREVGYALGFPRPLVDRVAKALETYDSVMVRRDLEADGGFAEFFRRTGDELPVEARAAAEAEAHGFVDRMGQLNTRIPLVGKVPPWRQPPKPEDPDAPRPFAWLAPAGEEGAARVAAAGSTGEAPAAGSAGVAERGAVPGSEAGPAAGPADAAGPRAVPVSVTSAVVAWPRPVAGAAGRGPVPVGESSAVVGRISAPLVTVGDEGAHRGMGAATGGPARSIRAWPEAPGDAGRGEGGGSDPRSALDTSPGDTDRANGAAAGVGAPARRSRRQRGRGASGGRGASDATSRCAPSVPFRRWGATTTVWLDAGRPSGRDPRTSRARRRRRDAGGSSFRHGLA